MSLISHKVIQVTTSCNNTKEAERIAKQLLKNRIAACTDILPRFKTLYYWPPKKGKVKTAKGCFLIFYTFSKHLRMAEHIVQKYHSDKVPFISAHEFIHINKEYYNWLTLEIKN